MDNLENHIVLERLEKAKPNLVPHIFSENYFRILKARLNHEELSYNERYYYNHFIKKKLKGMLQLLAVDEARIHGKEFIKKTRLKKAIKLLNKFSQKYKGMKLLISGSFLFKEKYNDIDIFVLSKYKKEDYREGKVHINYLPIDIQDTLFFKSISKTSISNFQLGEQPVKEVISIKDFIQLYEYIVLLAMQGDDFLPELREFLLKAEWLSSQTILNTVQLNTLAERIIKSRNKLEIINKYLVSKLTSIYAPPILRKSLNEFIAKNSIPEKGKKLYPNWKIYNETYQEVLKVVA